MQVKFERKWGGSGSYPRLVTSAVPSECRSFGTVTAGSVSDCPGAGCGRVKTGAVWRPYALAASMLVMSVGLVSCSSTYLRANRALYRDVGRPVPIMGQGSGEVRHLMRFFLLTNPHVDKSDVRRIARYYISEAAAEGVNHDVAFCQMCVETNYLRFGGDVGRWQNNFCGLGATGGRASGASFKTIQMGVRAHVQHLKAYASRLPLHRPIVDPRFEHVRRASAPYVKDLAGTWAADPNYGLTIRRKLETLAALL